MDKLLFVIMIGMFIFILVKNLSLLKRYKQNKEYVESYQDILHNKENCYERICAFIEKEKTNEYKNKANIIKLFCELNNDLDYRKTIEDLDIKAIYYSKGKIDKNSLKFNSDSFIFIMLVLAKAYEKGKNDVIETIVNKVCELTELENRLEHKEIIELANALNKVEDKGSAFMHSLLDGTYTEYAYDKNMIGIYKRIASSTLAFNLEQFDDYFKNDLHNFAKSMIGENFLKSLGIYELYQPIEEEVVEEDKQEENKE